ncbi:MAG TPA: prepilin-type N-terminal cleavage/methylation domain-containing protein, partial [Candidatus Pacearchaeota archaeon]|nr:prepilin-type N-terminal cleavage/methylation domain-containing protein [Candidatus Pacearchaeota archaeon]
SIYMINRNKQQSFTLIELLVVIVIIGILAGVIMISTSSSIDKANFAKAQTFSNTVQEELLLNLVSEWTFDEGTDQTINRVATNNDVKDTWGSNNGTVYGNPQIKGGDDCVSGKCISLNKDGYINCNNRTLNTDKAITISLWIKSNDVQDVFAPIIISKDGEWTLHTNNGGVRIFLNLFIDGALRQIAFDALTINQWKYFVATFNGVSRKMYVDGVLKMNDSNYSGSLGVTNNNLYIGTSENSINGLIDDIKIYNAALSTSQIKQNYIAGLNSMLSNGNISNEEYNERINELAEK